MPSSAARDGAERFPELAGLTALITGGTAGIGRACAQLLAQAGASVVISGRDERRGHSCADELEVHYIKADLADLDSVRACAANFLARGEPLHGLVNNAGVVRAGGLTKQGFELMFGVNHLGHFVLTNALLGCLTASAPARVVTVSSDAHYQASGIDFPALQRRTRSVTGLPEYAGQGPGAKRHERLPRCLTNNWR